MVFSMLILLLHALIFIIKAIIRAILCRSENKAFELILIQIDGTDIGIEIFVIIVKHTGFAIR